MQLGKIGLIVAAATTTVFGVFKYIRKCQILSKKESQIEELKKEKDAKQQQIEQKCQDLEKKDGEIQNLKTIVEDNKKQIQDLQVSEQKQNYAELSQSLSQSKIREQNNQVTIQSLENSVIEQKKKKDNLVQIIKEQLETELLSAIKQTFSYVIPEFLDRFINQQECQ